MPFDGFLFASRVIVPKEVHISSSVRYLIVPHGYNQMYILIVTTAHDNRLIKLTRELALYLMLKQRHGSQHGLV